MKDWEIVADNLSKAGWSWGCVSAVDCEGRTIWIADAYPRGKHLFMLDYFFSSFYELLP
jgi:hypothetical protein